MHDLLDVVIRTLEERFPAFRRIAPVAAFVALLLIVGFGLYALSSLSMAPARAAFSAPGPADVAPGSDAGVFETLWTADIGRIQDLALARWSPGDPTELLALVGDRVSRFDSQGRLLSEVDVRPGTTRFAAAADGSVPFFVAASMDSHWSWKDLRRITTAFHLTAFDPQGRTVWTYSRSEGASTSPFEPLVIAGGSRRGTAILVETGGRLVGLDPSGREMWSVLDDSRSRIQADPLGAGRPGVLALRPVRNGTQIAAFDSDGGISQVAWLDREASLHAWLMARPNAMGEPVIGALSMASTPDAAGKMPELFEVYSMAGQSIGRTTLPWPTRPIGRPALSTVDTDADGSSAWIAGGDDGAFYLISRDARQQERHPTGGYIRRFVVWPMPGTADTVVIGSERGLRVWRRRAQFGSSVD